MKYFGLIDLLLTPFVLFLIYAFARQVAKKRIEDNPEFIYFLPGLFVKILGAISICLIYAIYYTGGDTINYFYDGLILVRLLFKNPTGFYQVITQGVNKVNYLYFDNETGWPNYIRDSQTFTVVRIVCFIVLVSFRSIIVSNIIMAWLSFIGIWKMYRVFIEEFPHLKKEMATAFLFIPSVFFWGSGILKDTITLSMIGFYLYNFYFTFVKKKLHIGKIVGLLLSSYIILIIKPYIILALSVSSLVWLAILYINKIKGTIVRTAVAPILIIVAAFLGYTFLNSLGNQLGIYSIDKVLDRALTTQLDLKSDYYKGNSFDIGQFDATWSSMLGKAPIAIFSAIFRPTIFEATNPVMFISGVENLFLLIFAIRILYKTKVIGVFRFFTKHHLLTFSLVFSIFFAFSVGISTSNFGSLVRYRIPILPFFVASLYIISHYYKLSQLNEQEKTKQELDYVKTNKEILV